MSVLKRLVHIRNQQQDSPVLLALRSQHLRLTAAVLGEYFTGPTRRIPVAEFHELLQAELAQLVQSPAVPELDEQAKTASELCALWLQHRLLARRQDPASQTEYYELSSFGQRLLSILADDAAPQGAATQSRLQALTEQLTQLEQRTNPNSSERIAALKAQRAQLDQEIAELEAAGPLAATIDELAAAETIQFLAQQARQIPDDFARVKEAFAQIAAQLRQQVLTASASQEATLENLFAQLEQVDASDEGRSFNAFYQLLFDDDARTEFDTAIEKLTERGLLHKLPQQDQVLLSDFMTILRAGARPVRQMKQLLAANLRDFVRSRQYTEYQALTAQLARLQQLGLDQAAELGAWQQLPVELPGGKLDAGTLGRLALRRPTDTAVSAPLVTHTLADIDVEDLRRRIRAAEIDFASLTTQVNETLKLKPDGATIGQVLARFPAEQGLATVTGLLLLGMKHGSRVGAGAVELVSWTSPEEQLIRQARIDCLLFTKPLPEKEIGTL